MNRRGRSRIVARVVALAAVLAGAASCRTCAEEAPAASDAGIVSDVARLGTERAATRTLATLHAPLDALAEGKAILFGVDRTHGVVLAIREEGDGAGSVQEIAHGEHEPFAIVVRAGKPVWASRDGIFASNEDGGQRVTLVDDHEIRALGAGPHDVVFADAHGISRVEWPAARKPVLIVPDVVADEVVATVEAILWLERGPGKVGSYDLKSGVKKELAAEERKPHDLAVAGDLHSITWHEGESDLLPGRPPRAFVADTQSGVVRELAGTWDSRASYAIFGGCLVGPGVCKPVSGVDWVTETPGPKTGIAVFDSVHVSWVEESGGDAWRIVSMPLSACCR